MVTVAVAQVALSDPKLRKVVRLKLIGGGAVDLDETVPATRAECPTVRPCGHVRCRWHLWRVEADQQPGRPWPGHVPDPELRPAWMQWPVPPSCGRDEIHAVARSTADVAKALGGGKTQTRLALNRAVRKLLAALVERFGAEDAREMLATLIAGGA